MKENRVILYRNNTQHLRYGLIILLFICIALTNCYNVKFPSYYDHTTYKNLTDLKPQVTRLYDSFASNSVNQDEIGKISLKLSQMYEYEKGKGEENIETYKQISIIEKMFNRHVKDRLDNEKWSETHLENKKQLITSAFDIAIETEGLKNKNE